MRDTARRAGPARPRVLACVLAALAVALPGCGGGGDAKGDRSGPPERGGTLKVLASGDFPTLDPGLAYYQLDYMAVYATQRPLYTFRPDEPTTPAPDLAAGAL